MTAGTIIAAAVLLAPARAAQSPIQVLEAAGALPLHLSGRFEDPIGFVQAASGEYFVLDRRAHTIYAIDAKRTSVRKILEIGVEDGRVLEPGVLALSGDDIFAVGDAPGGLERIQFFNLKGGFLGGFFLQHPTRIAPRLVVDGIILNGVGSMTFTGKTFLVNRPEAGGLFTEHDVQGQPLRQVGQLRATGHEADKDLHLALNVGLPLADPAGGFVFVFQTGRPMFRRYNAKGDLVAERHIEGVELDASIQNLPTTWPRRSAGEGAGLPFVPPLVRTANIDRDGRLWISLAAPYTYVYNRAGDKLRTVQFKGGEIFSPTSFFFTPKGDRVLVTPGCYEFAVVRN